MAILAHDMELWYSLSPRARDRINAQTVKRTRYGWRVECRDEFGDNRSQAEAYWPKQDRGSVTGWSCRCRAYGYNGGRDGGGCSHIEAVKYLEACGG